MAQASTRNTTWSAIVGSAAFQQGMRDFTLGNPFPSDYDQGKGVFRRGSKDRWRYERGRLFAASCVGRDIVPAPARVNRRVNRVLISQASTAYRAGDFT
jgi:hypothetical protein